jgi:hypothetical protein
VIHTVKQDVATFNAQFPADWSKHLYVETPSTGHELTVRRPSEPPKRAMRLIRAAVLLEGCIRLTLIEITFTKRPAAPASRKPPLPSVLQMRYAF